MKRTLSPGVTINTTCIAKGHRWRPKVAYQVGTDVCGRRGCQAQRLNPLMEEGLVTYWDEVMKKQGEV